MNYSNSQRTGVIFVSNRINICRLRFISDVTDKILPQIEDWQNRPLDEVYPVVYIDATHYSVRDNGVIRKLAAYVILGINTEGKKEVLSIAIGENESAKILAFCLK